MSASGLGPAGFIGLGQIGAGLAANLHAWPDGLVVCDVVEAATAPFAEKGATVAATPADVARAGAGFISVMVLDGVQVREVVLGDDGIVHGATPGTIVAVHSTIEAETAVDVASQAAEHGVAVLDAPVTGGFAAAYEGRIAFMVGGEPDAVARARPVLELMSELIVETGPVGSATQLKVARNLLTWVGFAAAREAEEMVLRAGLRVSDLAAVTRHSDMLTGGTSAIMLRESTEALPADDGLRPIMEHTRGLGEKDLQLAVDLAETLGVDAPFSAIALERLADALGVPHDAE